MTKFLEKLEKQLKDPLLKEIGSSVRLYEQDKAKVLVENREPQPGIYYWIPLGNSKWRLYSFWKKFYGNEIVHAVIWDKFLAREVAEIHNKLNNLKEIENCPFGLPRGRVFVRPGEKLVLWHGSDSPLSDWKERIFAEFNLSDANTDVLFHPHEQSNPVQTQTLTNLLK